MKTRYLLLLTLITLALTPITNAQYFHAFLWDSSGGLVDLGTLPGGVVSYGNGINDNGQVVGSSSAAGGYGHAFVWSKDTGMVDLGLPEGAISSQADSINNSGEIAGTAYFADNTVRPFFWTPTEGFKVLTSPSANPYFSNAALNDLHELAGYSFDYNKKNDRPLFWFPGLPQMRMVGGFPLGYQAEVSSINNLHHMTGRVAPPNGKQWHAFVWTKAKGARDIGAVPGGHYTYAYSINDNDEVVGSGDDGVTYHGFYWSRATGMQIVQSLSDRDVWCTAINKSGVFVGFNYGVYLTNWAHAVIWYSSTSTPVGLGINTDGHSFANGINNLNQVVGTFGDYE